MLFDSSHFKLSSLLLSSGKRHLSKNRGERLSDDLNGVCL